MNELSTTEQTTIVNLLQLGWSIRKVSRETGRRHETIRRYGIAAGVLEPIARSKSHTITEVPTDSMVTPSIPQGRSSCEIYRDFILAEHRKGRNAMAIYQDLVEHFGYTHAYDTVKRFLRKNTQALPKVYCRFETAPGVEAQVDYGEGALTRDPNSGKYRRPRLFVMTLSASRHAFRKTVWKSSTQTWCELHEEAFAYFGGATKTIRLDNLKEGVLDPDIYDPELNPMYAKMLMHYGVLALPCRPYAPNLKGKVESAVGHTQDTGLAGRRFESIEQQNEHLMHWNERWAATRIHGTTKRQVQAMFEEERPHLIALPGNRFEYYRIFERVVHSDGHVEVHGAYYSVPPRYVGCRVIVHVGQLWLRIIDRQTHQCQREHSLIQRGRRRTDIADRPRQTPPSVDALLERAARISPSCGAFSKAMHKYDPDKSERRLFGLFDLARRYKPEDLERACALGLVCENYRLRFLRKYLSTHAQSAKLTQEHQAIASVQTYAAHFSHNA